ncbi:MAG: Bcr/CflA family efflux MFS transporter [Clostridia bacterium]|nr:Bcr/CflA family efflux MFS transporter [Clostridia bacterium]
MKESLNLTPPPEELPRTKLKTFGLILLMAVLGMAPPLSTDLYMPALPGMASYFQASVSITNLTLTGFFFFMAVGILICGPLSDKYGRKPILLTSLAVYALFSVFCALSSSIFQLIFFRIIQALGAGGMLSISMALAKACFEGKLRITVISVAQAMTMFAPMAAPILGAFLLKVATWRASFWILAVIGVLCFAAASFMKETLPTQERLSEKWYKTFNRLPVIAKNKSFSLFLLFASLFSLPFMAYLALSSYVYIDFFDLDATIYSYYFAANAFLSIFAPTLYIKLHGRVRTQTIIYGCAALAAVSGLAILILGCRAALFFFICFAPFTFLGSLMRPLSTQTLLAEQDGDTGSVSSLINFVQTAFGSLGMLIGSLPWPNLPQGLGIIILSSITLAMLIWLGLTRFCRPLKGLN